MPWSDNLDVNSSTYKIAEEKSQYTRVLAGPGTGKSYALKKRVTKLLKDGIDPQKILPITFTRVSAEDLQRELQKIQVTGCDKIKGWTIHALALSILMKRHVSSITNRVSRILTQKEEDILLNDLTSMQVGKKNSLKKMLKDRMSAWASLQDEEPGYTKTPVQLSFEKHLNDWLVFHQGMLIGEVVPILYNYLKTNPSASEFKLFDNILVDEYQDLNKAEQSIIDLLSKNSQVCIVGDDNQSIYTFKNAHPEGIQNFPSTHQPTVDHTLLDCYRCPVDVVHMANSLISHNLGGDNRQLCPLTENGNGENHIFQFEKLEDEVDKIALIVKDLLDNKGVLPSDIIILAQNKCIGNPIYKKLKSLSMPVVNYYQENQIETKEAQQALSYLRFLLNNNDMVSLRELLADDHPQYRSKQYVKLMQHCKQQELSPCQALERLSLIKKNNHKMLVNKFLDVKRHIHLLQEKNKNDFDEFLNFWLPKGSNGLEEIRSLSYKAKEENPDLTLEDLLKYLENIIFNPEIPTDIADVRVMSIHKSKGLSSRVVFIMGCVDGLIPRYDKMHNPIQAQKALEEDRRLFYVGITRVKSKSTKPGILILSSSRSMLAKDAYSNAIKTIGKKGERVFLSASPFLAELGEKTPKIKFL